MPHTYADLLKLADTAVVIQDGPGGQLKTTPLVTVEPLIESSAAAGTSGVIEADDDPHRLARVNLERYATRHDGRTLRYWRQEWYVWKGSRYQKIDEKEFRAKLSRSIKEEFDRINLEKQNTSNDGELPQAQKVTQAIVSNVLQATSGMVVLSADIELGTWIPTKQRRNYISMANGILDIDAVLRDAELSECLIPNSPQWFSMVSLPYAFDPDATCPRWNAFLEHNLEMDPERIKILQEWAGYLLLADTGEQKFLVLEGEGANGKSVYIAGLTAMLGEDNVSTVPLEIFGERFSRTETLGKLLNAAGDVGEIDKVAEGYIKSFSGGDRMFFDRKGVAGINCRPTARLMLACNNRPRFSDRSQGLWRRMLLVPWNVEITRERRVKGMDKIEWWQAASELPGILNWALIGLARLRAQGGFTDSDLMKEALQDYQDEMNPARIFMKENLESCKDGCIKSKALYSMYVRWAKDGGYHPLSEKTFGKEMKRRFHVEKKRGGTRIDRYWYYEGVSFTVDDIGGMQTHEASLF
jgi:P4 family phage/plasmid primase-like protien